MRQHDRLPKPTERSRAAVAMPFVDRRRNVAYDRSNRRLPGKMGGAKWGRSRSYRDIVERLWRFYVIPLLCGAAVYGFIVACLLTLGAITKPMPMLGIH